MYTEIFCDRGAYIVTGNYAPNISSLVKISTGLQSVNADNYIIVFVLGYIAIAFEHPLRLNKAASALITGVLCWTIYIQQAESTHTVSEELLHHLGEIASILFFLL